MALSLFQIDAFADRLFEGNPAAVCPLDRWLPDDRKDNCEHEYNTVKLAFDLTIKPKVDPVKLEKVKAMKILRPEDLK